MTALGRIVLKYTGLLGIIGVSIKSIMDKQDEVNILLLIPTLIYILNA